jgi:deoxyribose-phosphate aldolase
MSFSKYIDHTLLKANTTPQEIKNLCEEAIQHQFYAVCVNGCYVKLAKEEVSKSDVMVVAVIGFPLGAMSTEAKVLETISCIADGADEIDMVINIGFLQSRNYSLVENEIRSIKKVCGKKVLKVIIETCYLSDDDKRVACQLALNAGADFVKTSTGFGTGGATLDAIKIMKSIVGDKLQIKASGGIRDKETALEYINAGVQRIGTFSGIKIVS